MTQDEIIRMARDADILRKIDGRFIGGNGWCPALERFAALVAEATLEKAAKVCEAEAERHEENTKYEENADYANRCLVYGKHIRTCAEAIRSMK